MAVISIIFLSLIGLGGCDIIIDGCGVLDSHLMQPKQVEFFIVLAKTARREPKDVIIAIMATVDESII